MAMETLSEAMARLARAGYESSFMAVGGGVRCPACDSWHDAAEIGIDDIVRFEGDSDPADEAMLFALSCARCDARGTYATGHGVDIGADDVELVRRLTDRRH